MEACPASAPVPVRLARSARRPRRAAFTLIEVMASTLVLLFGILSSIFVLQSGLKALDNARNTTLAAQIMQSELERIRLLPWDTTSLDASGNLKPAVVRLPATETLNLAALFPVGTTTDLMAARFTVVRTSADVSGRVGEMKTITLTVTWRGMDRISHTRASSTQYTKDGLYDYYYTKAL